MIKLQVENYCHECPYFTVQCESVFANGKIQEHIISCSHDMRCMKNVERAFNEAVLTQAESTRALTKTMRDLNCDLKGILND